MTVLDTARPDAPAPAFRAARRGLRLIANAALAAAALVAVAAAVVIGVERIGFSPVLSPSMQPAFAPGDVVLTKPEAAADIRVGQVVALPLPDQPGQRYVHRIMQVDHVDGATVVRTKGDANAAPETFKLRVTSPTVPVVVGSIPRIGRLAVLLHGGVLRIVMIALIGLSALVGVKRLFFQR